MLRSVVAIVTGGGSGLGAAVASKLLKNGARVCIADLESQRSNFLRWSQDNVDTPVIHNSADRTSEVKGLELTYISTDVTDSDQVTKALDHIEQRYGEPVNVVMNCAGIALAKKTLSKHGPHPLEDFTNTIMVNLVGTFNVCRLSSERIKTRESDSDGFRGCIINTASIAAYEGQNGQVAYAASKGGIVAMTLPMARDLAPFGIRVVTIVRMFRHWYTGQTSF